MVDFRSKLPENLGVLVCDHVRLNGMPVLYVSHDGDGDWQFLCGGDHAEGGPDGAAIVCIKEIVALDASLNELARLCPLGEARRERADAPWRLHDRMEDVIRQNVAEHACHVMKVPADDQGAGFAYSIGLTRTYGQPELICFGLREEVMHWMINEIRDRMAQGVRLKDGERVDGLLQGYVCVLKRMDRSRYREHLGYARWFYQGDDFETLQIVWPDKESRYPWDAGYAAPPEQQPATWQPASA